MLFERLRSSGRKATLLPRAIDRPSRSHQHPTCLAWLPVYVHALLANQTVTSHRTIKTPEHLSRLGGQRRLLLVQPSVMHEYNRNPAAPLRRMYFLSIFYRLSNSSLAVVSFRFGGIETWFGGYY